jgi:ATP-dependent DNA ligase
MHARLDRGAVKLLTRTGLDWTRKYPAIVAAVAALGASQAYLDGELCGVFPDGITSFGMIQAASDAGNASNVWSRPAGRNLSRAACRALK